MYWVRLPNGTYVNLNVVHELMVAGSDVVAVNGSQSWTLSQHMSSEEAHAALVALMQRMGQSA